MYGLILLIWMKPIKIFIGALELFFGLKQKINTEAALQGDVATHQKNVTESTKKTPSEPGKQQALKINLAENSTHQSLEHTLETGDNKHNEVTADIFKIKSVLNSKPAEALPRVPIEKSFREQGTDSKPTEVDQMQRETIGMDPNFMMHNISVKDLQTTFELILGPEALSNQRWQAIDFNDISLKISQYHYNDPLVFKAQLSAELQTKSLSDSACNKHC